MKRRVPSASVVSEIRKIADGSFRRPALEAARAAREAIAEKRAEAMRFPSAAPRGNKG